MRTNKKPSGRSLISTNVLLSTMVLLRYSGAAEPENEPNLHYLGSFTADLPYDVPPLALADAIAKDQQLFRNQPATEELLTPRSQRLFDIFAWRAFLALNWPADVAGQADAKKTLADPGVRVWDFWAEPRHLFLDNGGQPLPWPATHAAASSPMDRTKAAWTTTPRADQNLQAFSGPLVDQNGKWVRYQVKINHTEYDYIVANKLYNLDGQIEFSKTGVVSFPIGSATRSQRGAIELKMAWRELGPKDIPGRYYTVDGEVKNNDTGQIEKRTLGLIGMHIAMRTETSPQWIWATFEHVDNVAANPLQTGVSKTGATEVVRPGLNNPALPTSLVNVLPLKNAVIDAATGLPRQPRSTEEPNAWLEKLTTTPVQVTRVIPIPLATAQLNAEVQSLLRAVPGSTPGGSVFQFYELIGVQWPVFPKSAAFPSGAGSAPESIVHKTPGTVVPVYVANTTMETYFQSGVQPAGPLAQDDRLPAGVVADETKVFGTESCVGCHYSSGIAVGSRIVNGQKVPIFGINSNDGLTGSANYSWLLQMEARFVGSTPPKRKAYEVGGAEVEPQSTKAAP